MGLTPEIPWTSGVVSHSKLVTSDACPFDSLSSVVLRTSRAARSTVNASSNALAKELTCFALLLVHSAIMSASGSQKRPLASTRSATSKRSRLRSRLLLGLREYTRVLRPRKSSSLRT